MSSIAKACACHSCASGSWAQEAAPILPHCPCAACSTEQIFETMRAAGFTPDSVTIAGGATRSELWLQIHADVSNVPFILTKARQGWRGCTRVAGSPGAAWRAEAIKAKVGLYLPSNAPLYLNLVAWVAALSAYSGPLASRVQVADAPALGCAILAAVAAGIFPDVPAACAAMVHQVGVASKGAGRGAHTHGLQYVNAEIPYTPRPLQCLPSVSDAAINFSLLTPRLTPSNTLMPLHHGSAGPGCAARPAAACRVPAALPGLHGAVPSPQAWVPRGSKPAAAAAGRCGATCSSSQWQPAGGRWSCRGAAFDRLPLHPVCRLCQPGAGRGPRGEGGCVWSGAGVPCAEGAHHTQAGPMLCRGGVLITLQAWQHSHAFIWQMGCPLGSALVCRRRVGARRHL